MNQARMDTRAENINKFVEDVRQIMTKYGAAKSTPGNMEAIHLEVAKALSIWMITQRPGWTPTETFKGSSKYKGELDVRPDHLRSSL